jgi:hypothetical protein
MTLPDSRSQIMIALAEAEAQIIHVQRCGPCIDGVMEVLVEGTNIL